MAGADNSTKVLGFFNILKCIDMYTVRNVQCHGGARQASNPWTAVSSLLALISREYA